MSISSLSFSDIFCLCSSTSPFEPQYRCARPVSTVLCVHDVQCLEQNCSSHGSCDQGRCSCESPWIGEVCDRLNCSIANCTGHGRCDNSTGIVKHTVHVLATFVIFFVQESVFVTLEKLETFVKKVFHSIHYYCVVNLVRCSDCPFRRYGLNCRSVCWCYGQSHCDPVSGRCVCPPGRIGYGCFERQSFYIVCIHDAYCSIY